MEPTEKVDHPPHYQGHPSRLECIDLVEAMCFSRGNAIKYLWRANLKNGVEDYRKALWCVNRHTSAGCRICEGVALRLDGLKLDGPVGQFNEWFREGTASQQDGVILMLAIGADSVASRLLNDMIGTS